MPTKKVNGERQYPGEAPRCHPYRHGPSLPGQIVENAPINAVDASRCQAAGRTFGHHGARPCLYGDLIRSRQHTGHSERTGNKGQQRRGHGQSTMDMSPGLSPIRPSSTSPASTESAGEPASLRHQQRCNALPRGPAGMTGFTAYVAESRARGTTWMMISDEATFEAAVPPREAPALVSGAGPSVIALSVSMCHVT